MLLKSMRHLLTFFYENTVFRAKIGLKNIKGIGIHKEIRQKLHKFQ